MKTDMLNLSLLQIKCLHFVMGVQTFAFKRDIIEQKQITEKQK